MNRVHGRKLAVTKLSFKTLYLARHDFNGIIESRTDMQQQPREGLSFQ